MGGYAESRKKAPGTESKWSADEGEEKAGSSSEQQAEGHYPYRAVPVVKDA
jgi:hypothetical protein